MTHHTIDEEQEESGLEDLLSFIRDSRGFDFTGYKRTSLTRRIRKRMAEVGVASYVDYRDRLESSAEEFGNLFNTILINVTGFFRDAEAWTFLQREIMPELIADTEGAEEIQMRRVAGYMFGYMHQRAPKGVTESPEGVTES